MQTSNANIYALGDCAEFEGQVKAYLQPTLISASALAKTLLGEVTSVKLPNMMVKVPPLITRFKLVVKLMQPQ
ncbi:hypothetical protein [Shewanella sp. 6_MG-2023]|nr:hypothetical protein [Shewanella sp. 6_MG-2023]MDO6619509.1 hypothetical protein [Shewanella sp. 6_MG-2023]